MVSFQTRPQQLEIIQERIEELAYKLVSDEALSRTQESTARRVITSSVARPSVIARSR